MSADKFSSALERLAAESSKPFSTLDYYGPDAECKRCSRTKKEHTEGGCVFNGWSDEAPESCECGNSDVCETPHDCRRTGAKT